MRLEVIQKDHASAMLHACSGVLLQLAYRSGTVEHGAASAEHASEAKPRAAEALILCVCYARSSSQHRYA